jgi:hypothetical protein
MEDLTHYRLKVVGHTPGAVKLHEVDDNGENVIEIQGACYLRKSGVGDLPIGSFVMVQLKITR